MNEHKIIFAGPVGSGKTSAIACLSEIPIVSTDVCATDEVKERKETTTVAMDYGFFTLDDGEYIHLYGTPGQERFDFMWDILAEGGLGLVLLLDATAIDPIAELSRYLDAFSGFIDETGAVIGITHSDVGNPECFDSIQSHLVSRNRPYPILEVDAREAEDVKLLVLALLTVLRD